MARDEGRGSGAGRLFFDSCNVVVTRGLFGATESVPKVVVVGAILAQTGAATSASIGLYLLIALACINGINTYDTATIEMLPELASVQPAGVGAVAARPTPTLALRGLVDLLVDTDESTPEGIRVAWRAASTVDDDQEEFHEAQLCVLLAAIVCLEERARLIRDTLAAAGVAITVMLTWGDTMSDYYSLALLFEAESSYRWIMLVALIFANVFQALLRRDFFRRKGTVATVAAFARSQAARGGLQHHLRQRER